MPQYRYTTTVKAPTGVALRFDSDATGTAPAVVYANAQGAPIDQTNPRQMVHSDQRDGTIQTVFGDVATVYVRGIDYKGNVVAGVIATIAGDPLGQSNQHGAHCRRLAVVGAEHVRRPRVRHRRLPDRATPTGTVADIGPADQRRFIAAMAGDDRRPRKLFLPDGTYKILQSGTDAGALRELRRAVGRQARPGRRVDGRHDHQVRRRVDAVLPRLRRHDPDGHRVRAT
jgi:hypothetical protein